MQPAFRWSAAATFALSLFAAAALSAQAEDTSAAADAAEPAANIEETVTVVASRGERPLLETPGSVTVITAEEIEKEGAQDLRDLLRFEPALQVDGDAARFGLGGFVVRGMGGNRVSTRIDGVPTGEEFALGPLGSPRMGLELDLLSSVELVKNGGSSLYGSDALGGVVAFTTKDPIDLLTDSSRPYHVGVRLGYDGRNEESAAGVSGAIVRDAWQLSLIATGRDGHETDNFGENTSSTSARTAPNPQDRQSTDGLLKFLVLPTDSVVIKVAAERYDGETDTDVLSSRGTQNLGPQFGPGNTYLIATETFFATDLRDRERFGLDVNAETSLTAFDSFQARLYRQEHSMEQNTSEVRATTTGGPALGPLRTSRVSRVGDFDFSQESMGGEVQFDLELEKVRLVYGVAYSRDEFDTIRNLVDRNMATGNIVVGSTPYPTKYFPESKSAKTGVFVQAEIDLTDDVRLVPGVRYDRYELEANENDPIYLSGNPGTQPPADADDSAFSPRLALIWRTSDASSLFVQAAHGFRAPPYSDINAGFTNLAFGYTQLPAPELDPEESNNFEIGWRYVGSRGSFGVAAFSNDYDGFIETLALGVNPSTGLLEYQAVNVADARIQGFEANGSWRLADAWRLRGALALTEGDNETADQPLNSVAPARLVLGFGYQVGRWGAELIATHVESKDASDLDRTVVNQFAAPSYTVLDLAANWQIVDSLSLQLGLWNLTDEKAWDWGTVNGVSQASTVLDRYTTAGRNGSVTLRWRR